jgi:hypothetical protein
VKEATKQATAKHHHHQTGVFSSAIPQIFSVIQEKLRLWPTSSGRGFTAGFTSLRMAGACGLSLRRGTWSGLLGGVVLVPVLHPAERQLRVVGHLRVRVAELARYVVRGLVFR